MKQDSIDLHHILYDFRGNGSKAKILFSVISEFYVIFFIKVSVLQIFYIIQGELPDEDEVYALIAALKRLYAFSWWVVSWEKGP